MAYSSQKRIWPFIVAGLLVLIILISAAILFFKKEPEPAPVYTGLPRMANLPPPAAPDEPPKPDYPPDAPILEQVRKALGEGLSPDEAVAMAKTLPDRPERADAAFLLLEYAAESDQPEAALAVGGYYDPTDSEPSGSIRKNARTAYEWYQAALKGGQSKAGDRLSQLHQWVEEKAAQGSSEARELMENWK